MTRTVAQIPAGPSSRSVEIPLSRLVRQPFISFQMAGRDKAAEAINRGMHVRVTPGVVITPLRLDAASGEFGSRIRPVIAVQPRAFTAKEIAAHAERAGVKLEQIKVHDEVRGGQHSHVLVAEKLNGAPGSEFAKAKPPTEPRSK